MINSQTFLSTGDKELDLQKDKTIQQIKDLCSSILEIINNPDSLEYDYENTYLDALNSLVKNFVDKARGSYQYSGYDGFIKTLGLCDHAVRLFNTPEYVEEA
jgi:hypothetical protein